MLEEKCPECNHVRMWSVGKLRKKIFRRKRLAKVKYWYCSVGEGKDWTVPFCGCKNAIHNLYK